MNSNELLDSDIQPLMDQLYHQEHKLKVSRAEFLAMISRLYRVGNISDHETNPNRNWTKPSMASTICCPLDEMLNDLVKDGIITSEEVKNLYDSL
jgi:hypothetical protein